MFAEFLRVAAVSLALGGVGFTALAQTEPAPAAGSPAGEDPVVAKVNGAEIRRSEVTRTITSLPPQVQQMPPQMIFPAVIDQIINGKLVAEAGYKNNVQNDPEVAERLKRSEERIVQELYLTREVQKRITAERLQEAYNKFKEENPPQDEVKASHILVEFGRCRQGHHRRYQEGRRLRQDRGREVFRQVGGPAGRRPGLLHQGPDGRALRQRRFRHEAGRNQPRLRCRLSSAGT